MNSNKCIDMHLNECYNINMHSFECKREIFLFMVRNKNSYGFYLVFDFGYDLFLTIRRENIHKNK